MSRLIGVGFAFIPCLISAPSWAFVTSDGHNFHSGIIQISAGATHTCALMADFHVSCWGSGSATLGLMPLPVPGLNNAIKIASGNNFACALLLDHTVSCWGDNSHGQLGDRTHTSRPNLPASVMLRTPFANVADITAGDSHVCAIKGADEGRAVWCWGSDTAGQLGNYIIPHTDFPQPIQVVIRDDVHGDKFLSDVETVSGGNAHTCAVFTGSHTLACWGSNHFLQVGNVDATSDIVDSPVGVKIYNGEGNLVDFGSAGGISAGGSHTCVLAESPDPSANYAAACWGSDDRGQVGNPVGTTALPAAVGYDYWTGSDHTIVEFSGFSQLSLGNETSCAIESKLIACWGDNSFGQLGVDIGGSSEIPHAVEHPTFDWKNSTDISVGVGHACALIDDSVFCWGENDSGQLGTGYTSTGPHYAPERSEVDAPIFTDNLDGN